MIFLCYASEDKDKVDSIYKDLHYAGLDPWMDKPPEPFHLKGIPPGGKWDQIIPEKIRNANYLLAFLSKKSVAKKSYVQREYRIALDSMNERPEGEPFLIPVLLEKCDLPPMRVGVVDFRSLQWFEWYIYRTQGLIDPSSAKFRCFRT